MKRLFARLLLAGLFGSAALNADTWTNKEGQTMEAEIVSVEDDNVVFSRDGRTYKYPIDNLTEEDQKRIEQWEIENGDPSPVAEELKNQLIRFEGRSMRRVSNDDLSGKRIFAIYYSAGWCGPCRAFTPDLVKFYEENREKHPELEIIFVSSDQSENAMKEYISQYGISFPAVKYNRRERLSVATRYKERGIPNLVFIDGEGEVLASSYVNGQYRGPRHVLSQIQAHLASK